MDKDWIINNYSKNEFSDFLENDYDGKILELLDSEGLKVLENSSLKKERISYILAFSKYKNEILKNEQFLDLFFKTDLSYYYANLSMLQTETYEVIIDKYLKLNPSAKEFAIFFGYFNNDYKLEKLNNWPYGVDKLYEMINISNDEIIGKIIKNYNINLSDSRINIIGLITRAKQSVLRAYEHKNKYNEEKTAIYIPVYMIDKLFAKKLLETYDIFKVRKIINDLQFCTNPEEVNDYIKNKEDEFINNSVGDINKFPYQRIFELFKKMEESKEYDDAYYSLRREYFQLIRNCDNENINVFIQERYKDNGLVGVYDYLRELSDREIVNYIIDYHFEENYYNIMMDLGELLRFYYDGNVLLKKDHVLLYEKIFNIDYLSLDEKKELHNTLKQVNIKEIFYDDMSIARHIVRESIKESALTRESINKYRDKKLSSEYGVDVYIMNDEPFFGIVKTGRRVSDEFPVGHSYSLVGNDCVAVYGNVKDSGTFLYDAEDLNSEQIVHVFPFDSFTLFRPFNAVDEATNRINTFMMPNEITGLSANCYSELLILERGRRQTDIDKSIPELKRIALYCVDEVSERDVETAKKLGLGIILVKSKKYFENHEYYKEKYKKIVNDSCCYFDGMSGRDKFEVKR